MKAKYKKWIKWGGIALGAVFLVAATAGIATAVTKNQTEDTRNLTQFDYSCYVLDDITGKVDKADASNISTNSYYAIDGLKCKLAKEAEITYQLNFYDEEKDFLSMLEKNGYVKQLTVTVQKNTEKTDGQEAMTEKE